MPDAQMTEAMTVESIQSNAQVEDIDDDMLSVMTVDALISDEAQDRVTDMITELTNDTAEVMEALNTGVFPEASREEILEAQERRNIARLEGRAREIFQIENAERGERNEFGKRARYEPLTEQEEEEIKRVMRERLNLAQIFKCRNRIKQLRDLKEKLSIQKIEQFYKKKVAPVCHPDKRGCTELAQCMNWHMNHWRMKKGLMTKNDRGIKPSNCPDVKECDRHLI